MQLQFNLFDPRGNPAQVTATGADTDDLIVNYRKVLDALTLQGFSEVPPNPKALPTVEHIIGFVLGEAKTRDNGPLQRCVFLYNDIEKFTYKTVTVYEPEMPELPLGDLEGKKTYDAEPGSSPFRASAINKKLMYPCDFDVMLKPLTDFKTGEPVVKTNPQGKPYTPKKYMRVAKVYKYPYQKFNGAPEAINFGMKARVFTSTAEAGLAYDELKTRVKPASSDAMWTAWIELINSKLDIQDGE